MLWEHSTDNTVPVYPQPSAGMFKVGVGGEQQLTLMTPVEGPLHSVLQERHSNIGKWKRVTTSGWGSKNGLM